MMFVIHAALRPCGSSRRIFASIAIFAPLLLMHTIPHEPPKLLDTRAVLFLVCFARYHAPPMAMMLLKRSGDALLYASASSG